MFFLENTGFIMTYHTACYLFSRDVKNLDKISKLHPKWEKKKCIEALKKSWPRATKTQKAHYERLSAASKLPVVKKAATKVPSVVKVKRSLTQNSNDERDVATSSPQECPVCYESAWMTTTPCQHPICVSCLVSLRKPECPLCRFNFSDTNPIPSPTPEVALLDNSNVDFSNLLQQTLLAMRSSSSTHYNS
jgi:hypothetical protein